MPHSSEKIQSISSLQSLRESWKAAHEKVVFTNGCFDILHLGHVEYLEKAAGLGTRLVVAVNADSSVRRLKGLERPINSEDARARILAALSFVDAVTIFEEDTPAELIAALTPDVLVKGSDYSLAEIVGADHVISHGGEVLTVDLVPGYSTTGLIDKMRN